MIKLLQVYDAVSPIGYVAVIALIAGVFLVAYLFLDFLYSASLDKPLFRHILTSKKLEKEELGVLRSEFSFYTRLSPKLQKEFEHRVATFITNKEWIGRDALIITKRHKVLVSAVACMVSFGRRNYTYRILDYILIYPKEFYSAIGQNYHKGEFNPKNKSLVLSWNDFENGFRITDDNLNLGIHELMHAMHLEAKIGNDVDSSRFMKHFKFIMIRLQDEDLRRTLNETQFFRAYAFTNQYEFMAVLVEYFFESPDHLLEHFPIIYNHVNKMLNLKFVGY
jgi:Mlc titration factor MtfA (ptsG expression regulator)